MAGVNKYIHKLLEFVESEYAGTLQTPKDFLCLSLDIQKRTGYNVSVSTIKRLFGYVKYGNSPSLRTLNTFSQFIGYSDFNMFCSDIDNNSNFPVPRIVLSDKVLSKGDAVMVKVHRFNGSKLFMLRYTGNFKFSVHSCLLKNEEAPHNDVSESLSDVEIVSVGKKNGYLQ